MTHKQQAKFNAMKQACVGLVAQVDRLTNDLQYMADLLDEIRRHPSPSTPPPAIEPTKAAV